MGGTLPPMSDPVYSLIRGLERLTANHKVRTLCAANAPVATVLGSIPASVGTVESEERQMKQC